MRRRMALFGVLGMLAVPCLARRTMTLEQLQKMLAGAAAQHRSDAALATQVYEVELNARLYEAALAPLLAESPGPLTKRALRAVADEAEFLPTAASQISARPAPEIAAQRQMMSQTVHYAARTLHELPNFLATRQTDSYDDAPRAAMVGGWPVRDSFQYRQSYAAPITYRDGHEINAGASGKLEKAAAKKAHKATEQDAELTSWGEFGPVLEIVLLDASKGKLGWSHWEERDGKPVAVFHFSIPQAVSHYNVRYDERLSPNEERAKGKQIVHIAAPYHGELAVDPETGAVQRVAIEAEMPASAAQSKAGMMVEYAPVRMGDTTCMCPAHSVVIAEIQDLYQPNGRSAIEKIVDRMVNDVRYTNYRRFGSDVQLVMRADAGTQAAPTPAPVSAKTEDEAAAAPPAAESAPGVAQGGGSSVVAAAPAVAAVEAPAAVAPAPAESDEEAIVRDVAEMPGMSAGDDAAKPSSGGFTLQVETRLVDMGVVVTDKHGKPVTDLRPEEIAIYDNGRLQKVAAFHHGDAAAVISEQPAVEEGSYTNDRLGAAQAEGLPELMVLLVDEGHLPFNDLNRARGEVEKFLESAKPGSRLALYAVGEHGFHALQDVTTDRALVEAKLKAWRPNAAEVSLAQEQEVRNRQQFDYVRNPSDLQYVNGNHENTPDAPGDVGADPQLRKLGDDPLGRALLSLSAAARHFAPVAGHKALVWISGDSALVDWRDQEVRADRSVEDRTAAIQHTMDALNETHMALYVVDASMQSVGGAAVDPSLANPDVELSPVSSAASAPGSARSRATATGRATAQMQQDSRGIQGPVRQLAESTGGRAFNKGADLAATLKTIAQEETALYEIGFHPDTAADGKFHTLKLEAVGRKGVKLRYRTGYLYNVEASTTKERFQRAVWSPQDLDGVRLRAEAIHGDPTVNGDSLVRLRIGFAGLDLQQKGDRWTDDLYIFLAQRDDAAQKAHVTEDTLRLSLKQETYAKGMPAGIPYQHEVIVKAGAKDSSVRVIVVDANSGKMGSVTIPAGAFVE